LECQAKGSILVGCSGRGSRRSSSGYDNNSLRIAILGAPMSGEFKQWLIASAIGCVGIFGLLWCSSWIIPDDPSALLRYVFIRLTAVLIGLISLSGGMLFVNFITPDDWMDGIGKNQMASAILMSAVVLVIGAILCWT
jgi:hypothetical protein